MGKPKNVFRIETDSTAGWQVRFKRQGRQHTKFFSDSKHGSAAAEPEEKKSAALQAAVAWRDATAPKLPEKSTGAYESAMARSKTKVEGIHLIEREGRPYIQAEYKPHRSEWGEDKRRLTSFSVEKRGLRKAVWKAVAWMARRKKWNNEKAAETFKTAHRNLRKFFREQEASSEAVPA